MVCRERRIVAKETFPRNVRPFKMLFLGAVLVCICLTLASLAEVVLDADWGLGITVFLLGIVASVWALFLYPVCGGCCGWDRKSD